MLIYLIIIFSIYFVFLLACIIGWQKFLSPANFEAWKTNEFVSVIIAVRDEEGSITPLLQSLSTQDFPIRNFEVIFMDDHSTDSTGQKILNWMNNNPEIDGHYFKSDKEGKKQALTEGIQRAKGEIILTTDADCTLKNNWIGEMTKPFFSNTSMVIGVVAIQPETSLFSKLQALEFCSLMGSGMALHALGYPVMCNGANLAFRKKSFEAVNGYEDNLHIPSGDDEFLMRKLQNKFPGSILATRGPTGVVTTRPQPSLVSFVHQRLRWAGKWKANDSMLTRSLALFILIFQITSMAALGLFLVGENRMETGILLGTKIILEGALLLGVCKQLHQPFSFTAFLLLQVIYPLYVAIIGVLSQLLDYEWKGRKTTSIG